MRLVAERNDWYSRYIGAVAGAGAVNPDLLPVGADHAHSEHHGDTPLNAVDGAGRHSRYYCVCKSVGVTTQQVKLIIRM